MATVPLPQTNTIEAPKPKDIVVTFNVNIKQKGTGPLTGVMNVKIGGAAKTPASAAISGKVLTITMAQPFANGDVVEWEYTPSPTDSIVAMDDTPMVTQTFTVTNNIPAAVVPVTWKVKPVSRTLAYGATWAAQTVKAQGGTAPYTYVVSPVLPNTKQAGTQTVIYKAADSLGAVAANQSIILTISAKPAIVITIPGGDTANVAYGATYQIPTATATGGFGNLTVTHTGTVDTNTAGTHEITYTAKDSDTPQGSATKKLTVTVAAQPADTVKPVITLKGKASVTIDEGTTYVDAGATATDNKDGDLTSKIVTVNPVNTATPGTYKVTFNVSDKAGNAAVQVTRTVIVKPKQLPGAAIEQKFIDGDVLRDGRDVKGTVYDKAVDEANNVQTPVDVHPAYTNAVWFDETGLDPYEIRILKQGIPK